MADSVIYIRDTKTSTLHPIKLVDNLDGTYSLGETDTSGDVASIKSTVEDIAAAMGGPQTLAPANDTVTAGYYAATTLHAVDADLAVGNIKTGVVVFGFTGTYDVEVTNPVAAGRMKTGDVAFVNGTKITGSGTKTLDPANDTVTAGYYAATTLHAVDTDLIAGNIKSGVTIFGIAGAATVRDISDADAVEADVALNKTFYSITGAKKTGSHV